MKRKIIVSIAILGIAAFGGMVYAGNGENENRQKIAMNELPIAVQKTIQDNLGGGTVTETAKETKDGKTYYEAEVQKSGGEKVEIKVTEDGKLIGVGKEVDSGFMLTWSRATCPSFTPRRKAFGFCRFGALGCRDLSDRGRGSDPI